MRGGAPLALFFLQRNTITQSEHVDAQTRATAHLVIYITSPKADRRGSPLRAVREGATLRAERRSQPQFSTLSLPVSSNHCDQQCAGVLLKILFFVLSSRPLNSNFNSSMFSQPTFSITKVLFVFCL